MLSPVPGNKTFFSDSERQSGVKNKLLKAANGFKTQTKKMKKKDESSLYPDKV